MIGAEQAQVGQGVHTRSIDIERDAIDLKFPHPAVCRWILRRDDDGLVARLAETRDQSRSEVGDVPIAVGGQDDPFRRD